MFGLGMGEIMIILVLALVLLGPARLPDAAKSIGKAMRDFRKATEDVKSQFDSAMYDEPKPAAKPKLVDAPPAGATPPGVPTGGVPTVAGEIPPASQQNVPGLEAALAEPAPQPAFLKKVISPTAPAAEPAAAAAAAPEAPAAAEAQTKA
ncbi:MAG TPA: twin-arginine translocase TatA/TatE family subunit [Anaeromyxobacteraceae bacterium]|nr:twin-arginine translocase TatA/TatE family subunit [Anaeromyxobacteraceae bacterium]